jgi:hypothetical protein
MLLIPRRELIDHAAQNDEVWNKATSKSCFNFGGVYSYAWCVTEILTGEDRSAYVIGSSYALPTDFIHPCWYSRQIRKDGANRGQVYESCWSMANIMQSELEIDQIPTELIASNPALDYRCFGIYPRPLFKGCLVQLSLHYLQLLPKDGPGYAANQDERQSEQANSSRPSRHNKVGLACFFFVATAAAVLVAFKSAEYADDRRSPFWWLPFVGLLALAYWFAAHAIGFTL